MNIFIANRQRARNINPRKLKEIAETLLADLEVGAAELAINLVAAHEMASINEAFLQHAGSTDVITVDYAEQRGAGSPGAAGGAPGVACPALHGEIFICVDEAISQSKTFRTTWQSEIVRYLIHGVLHLLGHDDRHAGVRRQMKREENRRLARLSGKFSLAQIGGASKLRA